MVLNHSDERRESFLIPVKSFLEAKERLAERYGPAERQALAQRLAEGVLRSVHPASVAIVCDDDAVASWGRDLDAIVIWAPKKGLNAAVAHGVATLEAMGFSTITVSHADLPFPEALNSVSIADTIVLVPDRHRDGTNVISLPTGVAFNFSYGPGSFHRHVAEAERTGSPFMILDHAELAIDIDTSGDIDYAQAQTRPWGP